MSLLITHKPLGSSMVYVKFLDETAGKAVQRLQCLTKVKAEKNYYYQTKVIYIERTLFNYNNCHSSMIVQQ